MYNYFEGWYFKHQKDDITLALIPGRSNDGSFIQVITNSRSYNFDYSIDAYKKDRLVRIEKNEFNKCGISLDIQNKEIELTGKLSYSGITPLAYDIMGPFRFLPMECRHGVISMNHTLSGELSMNGQVVDFTGGKGYIESDSGRSFPKSYTWVQCNDFEDTDCSVMASVAEIPFAGMRFLGCVCVVCFGGAQYRLATYKGVKIVSRSSGCLELRQGNLKLSVNITPQKGYSLNAPEKGQMIRTVHEHPVCAARFRFYDSDVLLFDQKSNNASFEHVLPPSE